jgi:hypothetical protein
MKVTKIFFLAAVAALLGWHTSAQNYDTNNEVVQTFAGSGFSGYLDGVGQLTMFKNPNAIVADSQSNLIVWDSSNSKIRKIAPDSTVTTFITNMATFNGQLVLTIDRNDTIWGVDGLTTFYDGSSGVFGTPNLYKITSGAILTSTNLFPVTLTDFHAFAGICVDSFGNIYISDAIANVIYRYTSNGVLGVFAGSGNSGYADGNGIFTAFNKPAILTVDAANNIYVWDSGNYLIRRIDQNQNVTTFAGKPQVYVEQPIQTDGVGTNAIFNSISQMCVDDSGNLILASGGSFYYSGLCIRKISATTNVVTMAGSFTTYGYANGAGNLARFNGADGVCISGGIIYVADSFNQRIRQITFNPQPQVVSGANLGIGTYAGVTITGFVGRTYQIQSSPDLNTWTTRATVLLTSSPYLWIDQNPVSGNKFYRAVLFP